MPVVAMACRLIDGAPAGPGASSRFVASDNGSNRTLEMTDPMGGRERLEYRVSEATMSAQDPAGTVPTIAATHSTMISCNTATLSTGSARRWPSEQETTPRRISITGCS